MKVLAIILLLTGFCTALSYSQNDTLFLKQRFSIYLPYFEKNEIPLTHYNFSDTTINAQLFKVLKYNQKRTNQIARSIAFGAIGTALFIGGVSHHPAKGFDGLFDFTKPGLIALSLIPYTVCIINLSNISSTNKKIKEELAISRQLLVQ